MMNGKATHGIDAFAGVVQEQAQAEVQEYNELVHEQERIAHRLLAIKQQIEHLNSVLSDHGLAAVQMRDPNKPAGGFAAPGNRSKNMPVRQVRWEGHSLPEIVQTVLDATLRDFGAEEMCYEVYEITTPNELKIAKRSLRSTLPNGVKDGRWDKADRGTYRGKQAAPEPEAVGV